MRATPRSRRALRVLGLAFILLGVPGLLLPFLPGVLMIVVGIGLVSGRERPWARFLERFRRPSQNLV